VEQKTNAKSLNEIFLVGLILGIIISIPQIFSLQIFQLMRAAGLSYNDPYTLPVFVSFFYLVLSPGISFPIMYFWARKRMNVVSQLKNRYSRILVFAFLWLPSRLWRFLLYLVVPS